MSRKANWKRWLVIGIVLLVLSPVLAYLIWPSSFPASFASVARQATLRRKECRCPRVIGSVGSQTDTSAAGRRGGRGAPKAPILYSVGDNLKDDGGSEEATVSLSRPPSDWEKLDRVVHLARQARP